MNLNAKELEKLRDIVKYLKVAIKARSFIGYRFITSPKNIRKEVLNTLKTVRQTAEVRQARDYLEDALGMKRLLRAAKLAIKTPMAGGGI